MKGLSGPLQEIKTGLKVNKEKWLEEEMREMEEDLKRHKHRYSFRRMNKLISSEVISTSTILDEKGQTLTYCNPEEKITRWQRHFVKVLNVQNGVAEEVVSELDNHLHG